MEALAPDLPLFEMGIMTSFLNFGITGDLKHIQFWIEHIIGKPKERMEIIDKSKNQADLSKLSLKDLKKLARMKNK